VTRSPRCKVHGATCRVLRAACCVPVAVLVAAAAAAQGRMANAKIETHAVTQPLAREVSAIAARGGAAWIGYRVPMVPGRRQMCCFDVVTDGSVCCGRCRLEAGGGVTMTTGDANTAQQRVVLEPPTEFLVLARVDGGAVERIRTFSPDCDIDAGGMPVVWLEGVHADDSVAWLAGLIAGSAAAGGRADRLTNPAMAAIALTNAPSALPALLTAARDDRSPRVRGQALFWLAQRAGDQAVAAITNAITNDPETAVKKKAVFALSQLPKDEGVPKLIEVARTNRNPEVRKQAFFWLGQSKDPRAVQFFEEILLHK